MNQEMRDKVFQIIDEVKAEVNGDIEKTMIQSKDRIKRTFLEEYKIDLDDSSNKELLSKVDNMIIDHLGVVFDKEEITTEEEPTVNLNVSDPIELISAFEKEIKEINKLEEKGKHAKATARSGRLINKLKSKIQELKNAEEVNAKDLEVLEKIEEFLDEQLDWHKNQLKSRYKNEFLHEKATFKALITVLPKGVAIQAKRVVNCINQLKEAKTNKERIFGMLELGKQIGILVTTPVTFTVKFIIRHWYLLLLLLLMLKLPKFGFGKNPQEDELNHPQEQPQEEYEPVQEPVTEHVHEPVNEPVNQPVLDPVKEPVLNPGVENGPVAVPDTGTGTVVRPGLETNPTPAPKPWLDPARRPINNVNAEPVAIPDTGTGTVVRPGLETNPTPVQKPALDPARRPINNVNAQPVQITDTGTGTVVQPEVVTPNPNQSVTTTIEPESGLVPEQPELATGNGSQSVQTAIDSSAPAAEPEALPEIRFEEGTDAYNTYMEMIKRVNERSNGHIYIREVAQNPAMGWDANPDLIVCNEPGEYIHKICDLYDLDPTEFFDPTGAVTPRGYEFILERHMMLLGNDTRAVDIIYQDPGAQYLADFQAALPNQVRDVNNIYDNITTINCFDTVDEFTAALISDDPKYDFLKESVTHFINVSETQEALNALGGLGLVMLGSAPLSLLGGSGAMTAAELAAYKVGATSSAGVLEAFLRLLQMAPEKAVSIYELLQGIQTSAPVLVPGM